jgi:hypothetical protein
LATITSTPVASIVNIVAGTHSGLWGFFFGGGGVYRERLLLDRGTAPERTRQTHGVAARRLITVTS